MIISSPQDTACLAKQPSSDVSHGTIESPEQCRRRLDMAHNALVMPVMESVKSMRVHAMAGVW